MSDLLRGLKEKMKFNPRIYPKHEYSDYSFGRFDGAEIENQRLKKIVLKEVGELVEALEKATEALHLAKTIYFDHFIGAGSNCKPSTYEPFVDDEPQQYIYFCDAEVEAREALAKFRGGK